MDVNDRSIRLDVLPTALALQDPKTGSIADTKNSSFAETLQQANSSAANIPSQPAQAPQPAKRQSEQTDRSGAVNSSPSQPATGLQNQSATDTEPIVPPADNQSSEKIGDVKREATPADNTAPDTISVSATAEDLAGGLIATTAPPISNPPTALPPATLAKALQSSLVNSPEPSPAALAPLPSIPIGLQAGLNSAGTVLREPDTASAPSGPSLDPAKAGVDSQLIPVAATGIETIPSTPPSAGLQPASPTATLKNQVTNDSVSVASLQTQSTIPAAVIPQPKAASASNSAATSTNEVVPSSKSKPALGSAAASSMPDAVRSIDQSSLGNIIVPAPILPTPAQSTTLSESDRSDSPLDAVTSSTASPTDLTSLPHAQLAAPNEVSTGNAPAGTIGSLPSQSTNLATDTPPVWEQVHPALHQALLQDRHMTMTLRPPELGAVQIDIFRQDGQVSARLQTETTAAHQLLTEHLPQLRDALTSWGVSADQVQVVRTEAPQETFSSSDSRSQSQMGGQGDAAAQQESQSQRQPQPQLADEPDRDESAVPSLRTRTALNLRV